MNGIKGRNVKKYITRFCVIALLLYVTFEIWSSSQWLSVEHFSMTSDKVQKSIRLVVLSDLHDVQFGEMNQELIDTIIGQKPDLVLIVGDMLNRNSKNPERIIQLVKNLTATIPVYYALGNHEEDYVEQKGNQLIDELHQAGANVLDKQYADIRVQNNEVRIGAMYQYLVQGEKSDAVYMQDEGYQFMKQFADTNRFTLFLSHRPESFLWMRDKDKNKWKIDAVFSGHTHGGQVRLPFVGGLYGAEQGLFPKYSDGKYQVSGSQFFVTRGLGTNWQLLPRLWNRPQVMVVEVWKSQ